MITFDYEDYEYQLTEELAEKSDPKAMMAICDHYFHETDEDRVKTCSAEQVKGYLEKLIADENSRAMLLLGVMYYSGKDIAQDYRKAAEWYMKAAEAGESYGWCNLGYCYYYGRDREVDYDKAYECFARSAFMENANAMYRLGDMFFYGHHVKEDKEAAFFWYEKALEGFDCWAEDSREEASVRHRLGKCYLYGHGTDVDALQALEYLEEAELLFIKLIENGNDLAKLSLPDVKKELENARAAVYSGLAI
jgi:TPR repeat protein